VGFVLVLACLAVLIPQFNLTALNRLYSDAEYSFYVNSLPNELPKGASITKNGAGFIVTTSAVDASMVLKSLPKLEGHSFRFKGNEASVERVLAELKGVVLMREALEGIVLCYAYSDRLGKSIVASGQKVNMQIALRDGFVTVGTPVILGSF